MKKIVILFLFAFISNTTNAQFELTINMVDSLIAKLYNFEEFNDAPIFLSLLNITSIKDQRNSLYVSATNIMLRGSTHENMMIYITQKDVFFIILKNVIVDSSFRSRLIGYNDIRFEKTLDSIRFGKGPFHGLVPVRTPLTVYRIRRKLFRKNIFVITSKNYIPYLSAPEEFIPIKKFAYGGELDEIEPWYYDAFGKLNKQYYEDLKPGKKIILKMPKEK